jgi:hypothetical protein
MRKVRTSECVDDALFDLLAQESQDIGQWIDDEWCVDEREYFGDADKRGFTWSNDEKGRRWWRRDDGPMRHDQ